MEKGAEVTGSSLSVKINPDVQGFVKAEHPEKVLNTLPEHHVGESVEHHTEPTGLVKDIKSAIKRQPGEDSTSSIRFLRVRRFLDKERSQLEPAA